MAERDEIVSRMLRHILTNLTSSGGGSSSSIVSTTTAGISRSNGSTHLPNNVNLDVAPSPSPPTLLAAAISNTITNSPNPSTLLTSTVITTTAKSDQHIYNSTGYLVDQDELEYSEYTFSFFIAGSIELICKVKIK